MRTPTLTQKSSSTIASWSATIIRALEAHGLDGPAIAKTAGIDPAALQEPDARVPRAALTHLWRLAVAATGDPCFGLTVARFPMQTTFHALGYAVLASTTLKEALERIIRYRRLIGDVVQLSIEEAGDRYRFIIDVSSQPGVVPFEAVDAFVAVTVRQARMLHANRDFNPLAVSLQRPAPVHPEPFQRVFRAPVSFSQPTNFLEYARADLERRLPAGNAEIARQNEAVVVRYLARLKHVGVREPGATRTHRSAPQRRAQQTGHRAHAGHESAQPAAPARRGRHLLQGDTERGPPQPGTQLHRGRTLAADRDRLRPRIRRQQRVLTRLQAVDGQVSARPRQAVLKNGRLGNGTIFDAFGLMST